MARKRSNQQSRPPKGLGVERLVVDGEELLVFSWSEAPAILMGLTGAEREVLARVVRGESNAAIARGRKTSERTVANQVASLLRKTGAKSRFDLIRRYAGVER
ncbi:MAG TPA: helix-turn-helix transcriptional regulator [Kofleriaceae bacterium]|nr:helix-turn-helix transcriptional regulator [Kofleriaceae bacterium]